MTDPAPSVYLFYGDDEFTIRESVIELRERLGDPSSVEMNFEQFDGANLDFGQFNTTCHALPFLSSRRMVVLERCERLPQAETFWSEMYSCLATLPESTALILIEDPTYYQSKRKDYFKSSKLWAWSQEHANNVYARNFRKPKGEAFLIWLQKRSQDAGVEIMSDASRLLGEFVEEDLRLAAVELSKLLAYVNYSRNIEFNDVRRVCISYNEANIFSLVDAMGGMEIREAMGLLRQLSEEQDIGRVFSMIVRQFRLLLLTREAMDAGHDPRDSLPGGTPDFVRDKLVRQASNFSIRDLKDAYLSLMQLDIENKTGQGDLVAGLDLFVLSLMRTSNVSSQH